MELRNHPPRSHLLTAPVHPPERVTGPAELHHSEGGYRLRGTSTIDMRQVVYSVPPSLIGRQVAMRLHHGPLIVYIGRDWLSQLRSAYGEQRNKLT